MSQLVEDVPKIIVPHFLPMRARAAERPCMGFHPVPEGARTSSNT
jgi:hypothetical protein